MVETKKFCGSPFGVQLGRFDVSGMHPRFKQPGGYTELPYDPSWTNPLTRRRGPGLYHPNDKGFNSQAVDNRASGPGWAREQEVETQAAMPHLLRKELYEERQEQKRKVGPGSYNLKDFIQLSEKPGSILGICEPRAARFGRPIDSITPGPGNYGKKGIPHTAMEEKNRRSTSTKGMMDTDARDSRFQMAIGCHLGPGTYELGNSIDTLLDKKVSLRGPYDLFSADRTQPVRTGHFATPMYVKPGPGQYSVKPLTLSDEWSMKHKLYKGKFGKVAQYPRPPAERDFNTVLAQCPKEQNFPGPGAYSPSCPGDWPKVQNYKLPPFLSTNLRMDKRSQRFFTGNYNSVGVGRYHFKKFDEAQHRNGHQNIFKAKNVRATYPSENFLRERIRGKDIPLAERHTPVRSHGLPSEETPRHMYSFRHHNIAQV